MNLKKIPVVYLAGGMRSNWQDQVMEHVKGAIFIDPRKHGLSSEADYTAWDLTGVDHADIIFGYIEKDNPNGAGLAVEFGWAAKAGNKKLIYVEEEGFPFSRYFGMVRSLADEKPATLEAGIFVLTCMLNSMHT